MESPRRITPPSRTRHSIPRRPHSSLRRPGRITSIRSHGVQTALTSRRAFNEEELANPQAIHVKAIGGDVLADNSWPEIHCFQSLAIHEQDLSLASGPCMSAAFKAGVAYSMDFGKLLHRQVFFRSAEEILHSRHGF